MPKFKMKRASKSKSMRLSRSPSPKSPNKKITERVVKPERVMEGIRARGQPVTCIEKAANILYQQTMKKRNQKHAISKSITRGKHLIDALACKEIKAQSTLI